MTEAQLPQTQLTENRTTFENRLQSFSDYDTVLTQFAYHISKEAHKAQWRIGGARYFEHLRGVALIILDECGLKVPPIIQGALLHDTLEDTIIFGDPMQTSYSKWTENATIIISDIFSPQTAEIVVSLTEPVIEGIEITDRSQAKTIKYEKLKNASPEALLVMADRLHNLRTFVPKKDEKTPHERIRETEEILIPIFVGALDQYPEEGRYLLSETDKAIIVLR